MAAVLAAHAPVLVLTGAGISTESGIPDYRGPDGTRRVTPMQHGEFVGSSEARRRYWARSFLGWQRFSVAEPNAGHRALAALQRGGRVGTVITQNVDGLHQVAGTRDVVELHGSLADVLCLTCGDRTDRDLLQARMTDANPGFAELATDVAPDGSRVSSQIRPDGDIALADAAVTRFVLPRCLVCGADTLKPDVVFFGGSVPRERVGACYALTDAAPALLVLGSSLRVMSGYRFVRRAAARGIPVVVVTRGPTRGDAEATHRLDAPLGPTLAALAAGA
ncbi:MAG TPA: NAD-dependent protein deacetylase [Dermatophilaceae bacterium]|nr:NAD-dependent protein deacetylase [Dermatophilaceae bacterium]